MRVYISGPITGTNDYVKRFCKAEKELIMMGFSVINPVAINCNMPSDMTYEEIMNHDFFLLDMCDSIYMLDKWCQSRGSVREYNYSVAKDKNILFENSVREVKNNGLSNN